MTTSSALLLALASQASPVVERTLQLEMRPSGDPQIAVWLEDPQGTYVETLMVTRLTGTFGLGNRPGRPDFGSGYLWPYGRREMVLPVWAHRRGMTYPRLVFQDCREDSLGWHEPHSSNEPFYCRPLTAQEQRRHLEKLEAQGVDAVSCPTVRFNSDKGIPMDQVDTSNPLCRELSRRYRSPLSVYPPRNDLQGRDPSRDWAGVGQLDGLNELDTVSQATPPSGVLFRRGWRLPSTLAEGEYAVWIEVNQAYDENEHHDYGFFTDPMLVGYGVRVVGQPSVVWRIPITIGGETVASQTNEHVGYGSPDGQDGILRPADGTITVGTPGTGAGRLLPIQGEEGVYQAKVRLLVQSGGSLDPQDPGSPGGEVACEVPRAPNIVELNRDALGFDLMLELGASDTPMRYEIRYREGHGSIQTEDDFDHHAVPFTYLDPGAGTTSMAVRIDRLRPQLNYTIGVRAENDCGDQSEIATLDVGTEYLLPPPIDACFVATAAHGAAYAKEVRALRRLRDEVLVPTDFGLAAVELYYYVSPPLAAMIRDNSTLQATARVALTPLVWLAESL